MRIAGAMFTWVWLSLGASAAALAQAPGVHYVHQGVMPPGAIGSRQLQRGGPVPCYYQPVEIKAPAGALISLAVGQAFGEPRPNPVKAGMLIGQVYRIRVTNLPLNPGQEVFPSIEVIDRLYPPAGQELRFPIPIELTREDLELALSGKFVTRVIYLEDPMQALPVPLGDKPQNWFELAPGRDPLAAADALGRPVAILRLGARLPGADQSPDANFFFGGPPLVEYAVEAKVLPAPPDRAAHKPAGPQASRTK